MSDINEVKRRCAQAQFYSQHNGIYVEITHGDNEGFVGFDLDSGQEYRIEYSEIDLAADKFYKLVVVE